MVDLDEYMELLRKMGTAGGVPDAIVSAGLRKKLAQTDPQVQGMIMNLLHFAGNALKKVDDLSKSNEFLTTRLQTIADAINVGPLDSFRATRQSRIKSALSAQPVGVPPVAPAPQGSPNEPEATSGRPVTASTALSHTPSPGVPGSHMSDSELPGIDDDFESYLKKEVTKKIRRVDREAILASARVAFYGTHYDRLYQSNDLGPWQEDADLDAEVDRTLDFAVSADAMKVADDLYERFVAKYPAKVRKYRPHFRGQKKRKR